MVEQKLPPYTQYAATDEMQARGIFPGEIELTVRMPAEQVTIIVSYTVEDMSEAERAWVSTLLQE
jgi:hypothetical protein